MRGGDEVGDLPSGQIARDQAFSRRIAARSGLSVILIPSNDKPIIAAWIEASILPVVEYCRVRIENLRLFQVATGTLSIRSIHNLGLIVARR